MNYRLKIDLKKLGGAFLSNIKGANKTKRCLIIPVDAAGLYVGEKGIYLDLSAIELKEKSDNRSHFLRVQLSKEQYEALSDEERKSIPIVGNMKESIFEQKTMQPTSDISFSQLTDIVGDLPF